MSRRTDKVNELLRREIGTTIQRDFEFPGTIVTVIEVEVTDDLKEGKVWVGVVGKMSPAQVLEKLNSRHGLIQSAGTTGAALTWSTSWKTLIKTFPKPLRPIRKTARNKTLLNSKKSSLSFCKTRISFSSQKHGGNRRAVFTDRQNGEVELAG